MRHMSWPCVLFYSDLRVPNRTTQTLLAVITKYCARNSVIHTDGWKAYNSLSQHGYIHKTVIHEENYVDLVSSAHTQAAERQWVEVRAWWRRSRGSSRLLQSHFDEISWRELHRDKRNTLELLEQFINDIKRVHGPRG